MNGIKKKIEGILPVTTTECVYLEGTSTTLQEAINTGMIGVSSTSTTSGRGLCMAFPRGCEINIEEVPESSSSVSKVKYVFPTDDSNRFRRLFIWKPSGGTISIEIPDGELSLNDALIYNFDTNELITKNASWGNVSVGNNELLLLYNSYPGKISGVLYPFIKNYDPGNVVVKDLEFQKVSSSGNPFSQGMFIIGNYLYIWGHSSDDRVTTLGDYRKFSLDDLSTGIAGGKHNLGHMNSPSYCPVRDMMIVGNGSKITDQTNFPMAGYIYKNFSTVMESNPSNIVHDDLDKITLDLSQFTGEFKAQLCWGDSSTDYVYLMTCENRIIRKLLLNKTNGVYDGTYSVEGVWRTTLPDVNGGFKYYNGYLLSGVKREYGIRKMELCTNGRIKDTYIHPNNMIGTMQGLDVKDDYLYAYTERSGYKININKI